MKLIVVVKEKHNNRIHLSVKSVTFFAMQKNRLFLRQVMRPLAFQLNIHLSLKLKGNNRFTECNNWNIMILY